MIFQVGQWHWHLSTLHHFDELVNKIDVRCGAWVVEMEIHGLGLRGRLTPMYLSPEGSVQAMFGRGNVCSCVQVTGARSKRARSRRLHGGSANGK
jgi:hypothetical protein